jgi:hypothetical protein
MTTMGGTGVQASVQNVVFLRAKMARIDRKIGTKAVSGKELSVCWGFHPGSSAT